MEQKIGGNEKAWNEVEDSAASCGKQNDVGSVVKRADREQMQLNDTLSEAKNRK